MALTRVTSTVVSSNAITSAQLSNNIIEARHIKDESVGLAALTSAANTASAETRLNANLNATTANINSVQGNVVAAEANVVLVRSNITSFATFANTNLDTKANVSATFIQLNSNINVVQNNVAAIIDGSTAFTGQVTMNDDLIVAGNLVISGDTTTSNSVNMIVQDRMIMLANSATGTPADDVGFFFNRGNQGNAAFFYDESARTFKVSDTKDPSTNTSISPVTAGNLDVGILTAANIKYTGTDLHVSITDNVAALTTNINTLDANSDAIEARRVANVTVMHSNDFVSFTRLNANLNSTTANINIVQNNVAALAGGAIISLPFQNINTSVGTSNVFFIGKDVANQSNITYVTLDGVFQTSADYVLHTSNETIQFKEASIPSGVVFTVHVLTNA